MAYSPQVYGVISQVLDSVRQKQDVKQEKANTLVTAIGAVITAVVATLTYLIEEGVPWLPEWAPLVVTILGVAGTTFGVSRTKNGLTGSVVERINAEIADLIENQERDGGAVGFVEPVPPTTVQESAVAPTEPVVHEQPSVSQIGNELDVLARRIAQGRE